LKASTITRRIVKIGSSEKKLLLLQVGYEGVINYTAQIPFQCDWNLIFFVSQKFKGLKEFNVAYTYSLLFLYVCVYGIYIYI